MIIDTIRKPDESKENWRNRTYYELLQALEYRVEECRWYKPWTWIISFMTILTINDEYFHPEDKSTIKEYSIFLKQIPIESFHDYYWNAVDDMFPKYAVYAWRIIMAYMYLTFLIIAIILSPLLFLTFRDNKIK